MSLSSSLEQLRQLEETVKERLNNFISLNQNFQDTKTTIENLVNSLKTSLSQESGQYTTLMNEVSNYLGSVNSSLAELTSLDSNSSTLLESLSKLL